jgi:flagellar basal body-associated protein FliL
MNPTVWIALVIVIAVVAFAFIFRGSKLKNIRLKGAGMEAQAETHEPPMQEITGNVLKGTGNRISTERGDTHIRDNTLDGENLDIDVKQPRP